MIKRRMPVCAELTVSSEYSKDGGATWTALPASTALEVDPAELSSENKLMLRTAESIESIDSNKLELSNRIFESVNVKNAKTLTSINSLFKNSIINNIRVSNTPNIVDSAHAFSYNITDSIFIDKLPKAKDVNRMFSVCRSKAVSNIVLGEKGEVIDNAAFMFYSSVINTIGDILLKGKAITEAEGMFHGAGIDMFPFIDLTFSNTVDQRPDRSYRNARIFRGLNTKYILEGNVMVDKGDESTASVNYRGYPFTDNDSTTYSAFGYMQARFSGLTIIDKGRPNDTRNVTSYMFYSSTNLLAPFRLAAAMMYGFTDNISRSTSGTKILDKITQAEADKLGNTCGYVEIPNWMEDVIELEVLAAPVTIGATSITVKENNLEIYSGALLYRPLASASRYNETFKVAELHGIVADKIYGSRNGIRVHRNGSEFKVFDVDGVLTSTINDTANIVSASMSEDGSLLYLIVAQSYDTVAGGDQQLTGSVRIYNSATGSLVEEKVLSLPSSHQLIGVWKPNSESNWQFIMRKWADDGNGVYVEGNSVVNSEKADIITKTISLSIKADMVAPNYAEDNEFMCVNTLTGQVSRCFGK